MGKSETKLYRGILYNTSMDVQLAQAEEEKIKILKEKINLKEPRKVLELYNTMVDKEVFHTHVGYDVLMELRNYLLTHEIQEMEIRNLRVAQVFAPKALAYRERKMKEQELKIEQKYRGALKKSIWLNIGFVIIVVALFLIMLSSDKPTIINYEYKIQDKYASWEQELKERESTVRQKERELGITIQETQENEVSE